LHISVQGGRSTMITTR
nr:immunoglobulin heavy chain junction region [Mus musculus]